MELAVAKRFQAERSTSHHRVDSLDEFFLGKTVLITGASSGLGKAVAFQLAQRGSHLILVARDQAKLSKVASEVSARRLYDTQSVETFSVDVSDSEAVDHLMRRIHEEGDGVDILVNNAGFGGTNLCGTIHMTRSVLPFFKERGVGQIGNVASMSGLNSFDNRPVYAATKAAVISFSEGLASQLSSTSIRVSLLLPSDDEMPSNIDDVASAFLEGLMQRRLHIIPGFRNRMMCVTARHLPGLVRFMLRRRSGRMKVSPLRLARRSSRPLEIVGPTLQ